MSDFQDVLTEGRSMYERAISSPENRHLFTRLLTEAVERANFALDRLAQTPEEFRDAYWLLIETFLELEEVDNAEFFLDRMEEAIEERDKLVSNFLLFKLTILRYRVSFNLPHDFMFLEKDETSFSLKRFFFGWFYARQVDRAAKDFLERTKWLIQSGAIREPFIFEVISVWIFQMGVPALKRLGKDKTGEEVLKIVGLMPDIAAFMKQGSQVL